MHGVNLARSDEAAHEFPIAPLGGEIDGWRRAVLPTEQLTQIEAGSELAVTDADHQLSIPVAHRREVRPRGVVDDQPHGADGRGGWNGDTIGLVVERDIAAHDREVERPARLAHAVDGPDDLAHDLG